MDSAALRKEILAKYPEPVPSDDALVSECISICRNYNLEPIDLLFKLEAMNYTSTSTRSEISPITMDTLIAFKVKIQRDLAKENSRKVQPKARVGTVANIDRSRLPAHLLNKGRSVEVGLVSSRPSPVKKEALGEATGFNASNVVFQGVKTDLEEKRKRAYRYMYEKISERSEALDQMIDEFSELIKDHYDIADIADPSSSTDEEVTIVGRIIQDSEVASTSKLTEASLTIESSRMLSSGARIPLRLDPAIKIRGNVQGAGGAGFYPGVIIALQGKNGGGGYFFATTILAMPPLKPSPASYGVLDPKADPGMGETPASVCIACGPFTPDSDLSYKPWRSFMTNMKTKKPTVLLLTGPFIDSAHPKIKAGDSDVSPPNLFRARFLEPLRAFLNSSPGSIAILIPSVRDMLSHHPVFPQCEFESDLSGFDSRIYLQPNPARFTINDISFGTTSVDVLFHLRKEEYVKRGVEFQAIPAGEGEVPSDIMTNCCRHLLNQRSFYPLFPVPQDLSHEVNLDISHWDESRMVDDGDVDYAPDVLILPSRLKQFTKVVNTTLAINPSFLSKGTYATLNIGSRSTPGGLRERLKVEIESYKVEEPATVKADTTAV